MRGFHHDSYAIFDRRWHDYKKEYWKRNCAFSRRCRLCDRALKLFAKSKNQIAFYLESVKLSGRYPEQAKWQ